MAIGSNYPQTTYSLTFDKALPGQPDDSDPGAYDVSRYVVAGANISAGKGVVKGSTDTKVQLPSGNLTAFQGFVLYDASRRTGAYGSALPDGTSLAEGCTVRRRGKIYVYCETAAVKGTPVYIRHTTHGALVPGDVRNDADLVASAATADTLDGAVFDETISGAGTVRVEINFPA